MRVKKKKEKKEEIVEKNIVGKTYQTKIIDKNETQTKKLHGKRKVIKKKMSRRKWKKITTETINILSNQKKKKEL